MTRALTLALLMLAAGNTLAGSLYSGVNTHVTPLNARTWSNQVVKARSNENVLIVHFYKASDGQSRDFSSDYEKQAQKMKGIIRFTAVDCDAHGPLCSKESVTEFPTVKVYPPVPIPPFVPDAGLNAGKIAAWAAGYVPSQVVDVTDDNVNGIVNSNPSVPKAVLFTSKQKTPLLWKAISNSFKEKLLIGIAREGQRDAAYKFGVTKYPQIVVYKTGERRPIPYKGKFGFQDIFDFLNIYSEQFVAGGGSSAEGPGDKPWLNEAVPQLMEKSANDVCLGAQKVLCVILFHPGKPSDASIQTMKDIRREYDNKLGGRSVSFKFMWLDTTTQAEWVTKFKAPTSASTVVLNTGRRKRYLLTEGVPSYDSLNGLLEKILGGDARFTPLRPNQLPKLA